MNDYLNHKWRKFINEDKKPVRKRLAEVQTLREDKSTKVEKSEEQKVLYYPKFRVTDDFGKKGNPSRDVAELFFKQISRRRDLASIINGINSFIKPDASTIQKMSVKKCLGSLTFLDTLSTIVHKFDPSSAGYLLEPFMAAVYGGKGKQVKTNEGGIEDIWDFNGEKVSLKLLSGGPTKGSLRDLRRTIQDLNNGQPITYVLVEKVGEGEQINQLIFYQFTIGTDGREWHWMSDTGRSMYKGKKATKKRKAIEPVSEVIDFIPASPSAPATFIADQFTSRANPRKSGVPLDTDAYTYAPPGDSRDGYEPHEDEISFGGGKAPQFNIPWTDAREGTEIGRIEFGGDNWVQERAQAYVDVLENGVTQVYEGLDTLTNSINKFLIQGDSTAGMNAQRAATSLSDSTECVIKKTNCPVPRKK
jgi:hypothetical protein